MSDHSTQTFASFPSDILETWQRAHSFRSSEGAFHEEKVAGGSSGAGVAAGGCGMGSPALPYMRGDTMMAALNETGAGKITHIVYIVQENRSFDNLFHNYPGADTVSSGKNSHGQTIELQPVHLNAYYDIDHSAEAMFSACNAPAGDLPGTHCRMNGFDLEQYYNVPQGPNIRSTVHAGTANRSRTSRWHAKGRSPTGCSNRRLDESFVAHQYIIAAQAQWASTCPTAFTGAVRRAALRFGRSRSSAR